MAKHSRKRNSKYLKMENFKRVEIKKYLKIKNFEKLAQTRMRINTK